jgi:nitroreductase
MDLETVDELLTTTRSVRKRLDLARPVEPEIVEECIALATQAPSGSNAQTWEFVVVTEPELRAEVAAYYRRSYKAYAAVRGSRAASMDEVQLQQARRVASSADYLAEHMHRVPVLIIPCIAGRVENEGVMAQAGTYGSILPAAWSLMLALRSRGLGSAWTTLHLRYEREVADMLGIPPNVTQTALLPVAYAPGPFKPAARIPARERTSWNGWGKRKA